MDNDKAMLSWANTATRSIKELQKTQYEQLKTIECLSNLVLKQGIELRQLKKKNETERKTNW